MSFRGRPPVIKDRDDKPEPLAGAPKCPSDLDDIGKRKWKQIVKVLGGTSVLTQADLDILVMYCTAYSEWYKMMKVLRTQAPFMELENGQFIYHPALPIRNAAEKKMERYGSLLGLNPVSRERLHVKTSVKNKGVAARDRSKSSLPPPPAIAGKVG